MNKQSLNINKTNIVFLILFAFISNAAVSQQNSTIYWMQGIPQSIYTNPAFQPDANTFIGMPGLSSINLGFAFSGFKVSDFIIQDNDSFYVDEDNMLSKLRKNNYIGMDFQQELLAFGFRRDESYFSLSLSQKVDLRFGLPEDFMILFFKGNEYFRERDQSANLGGIGINATHYGELAIGYSRPVMDELQAGIRAKLLFGMGNINFDKSDLSLYTDPNTFALNLRSDIRINTSFPFLEDGLNFDNDNDNDNDDEYSNDDIEFIPQDYFLNSGNMGLAFDIGGVYDIDDRFSVGLSIVDLGFISWKSGVNNFSMSGEFDFDGIDMDFSNNEDDEDLFELLMDSIADLFDIEETQNNYRTMLPVKIFLSGTYNISDMHKAGFLFRSEIFDGGYYPSFTLAYSIQPIPYVGASLTYSVIHGNFSNVGLGLHLNLYPLQIYMVTDNFISSMRPHNIQTATMQVGLNWVIGYTGRQVDSGQPLQSW